MAGRRQAVVTEMPVFTPEIKCGFEAALDAAIDKWGATAPNPSVGCALLDVQGKILGLGAHPEAGGPHAEIVALEAVRQAGLMEHVHHAIVTLEPCAHHGRTPPCSTQLLQSPAQTIWIGARDPNMAAAGGAALLGTAGRQVMILGESVSCEASRHVARQCQALLAPFASSHLRRRPWISVKQALNEQGSMLPPAGKKTFTAPPSLHFAHRLRRATDAVITGLGTILADHPALTVRHVVDHTTRLEDGFPRLLVVCTRKGEIPAQWKMERQREGFTVEICRDLNNLPEILARHSVLWAMVEAGPGLLQALESTDLWDDWLTIQQVPEAHTPKMKDRARLVMREALHAQGWQSPLALLAESDKAHSGENEAFTWDEQQKSSLERKER